jgi:hypothetical protein
MVTRMRYETGMTVAAHHHEHEQAGYVIRGGYRQTAAGTANELRSGDSYVIAGNVEHSLEVLEGGFAIDVFTPPRDDYRQSTHSHYEAAGWTRSGVDEHQKRCARRVQLQAALSPSTLNPSSTKNAVAAARSSNTMPTFSTRWIVIADPPLKEPNRSLTAPVYYHVPGPKIHPRSRPRRRSRALGHAFTIGRSSLGRRRASYFAREGLLSGRLPRLGDHRRRDVLEFRAEQVRERITDE